MLRLTVLGITLLGNLRIALLHRLLRVYRLLINGLALRSLLISLIRLGLYRDIYLSGLGNNTLYGRP